MPPVNTPMMQQYLRMKEQHPDCILMFRLGDFYEMFNEDARLASRELDLTLTSRDRGKPEDERTPMCGVPYHSADAYIARLIAKGYKVAICEQMEDPATAKGLVDRDIIRIGAVIGHAARLPDDTPKEVKAARFQRLVERQDQISEEKHAAYVGKTVRCLVDGKDEKGLTARTPGNRLVRLTGDEGLIGRFADVRITGANKWSLSGEAGADIHTGPAPSGEAP